MADLRAVVISVSENQNRGKNLDMREVLQISNKLVKRREKTSCDVPILDTLYSPRLQAFVCIYERIGPESVQERKEVKSEK